MRVTLIARTRFSPEAAERETDGQWEAEYDAGDYDASSLSEFAGRQCYRSWRKPNPATATNEGYLSNIIAQRHYSVLEHGTASFRVSDVSRTLTHELVRHRHFSYSQLSQRFDVVDSGSFVTPPLFQSRGGDDILTRMTADILHGVWIESIAAYDKLVAAWLPKVIMDRGKDDHRARKIVREAARCVLPNMTPTAIVISGNHLAWREMLIKRGSLDADAEIRKFALKVFAELVYLEPNLYQDFHITEVEGEEVLARVD